MAETAYLDGPNARLAYARTPGEGPTVVFLSGYKSDMEGTKAVHLEAWAEARGRAFLRLDYSGHGQSGGVFEEGCIGDWAQDAQAVIEAVTEGPLVLVGSSMGGWIACLLAKRLSARLAGVVGIAAAPDFTEDGFWAGFSDEERDKVVLRAPLPMAVPVRLMQGTEDEAVTRETALRLLDHIEGDDVQLCFVKGADHRFSAPANLAMIEAAIVEVGG